MCGKVCAFAAGDFWPLLLVMEGEDWGMGDPGTCDLPVPAPAWSVLSRSKYTTLARVPPTSIPNTAPMLTLLACFFRRRSLLRSSSSLLYQNKAPMAVTPTKALMSTHSRFFIAQHYPNPKESRSTLNQLPLLSHFSLQGGKITRGSPTKNSYELNFIFWPIH